MNRANTALLLEFGARDAVPNVASQKFATWNAITPEMEADAGVGLGPGGPPLGHSLWLRLCNGFYSETRSGAGL